MRRPPPRRPAGAGISEPMPPELRHAWSRVVAQLRREVPEGWPWRILDSLEPRGRRDRPPGVAAPDQPRGYVADRFGRVLQACTSAALGPEITVEVIGKSA